MDAKYNPFPDDFPDGIPPEEASDASGLAYRLVKDNPPGESDFVGHYKEPYKGSARKLKPGDYGTSMFRSVDAIKLIREASKPQRNKKIAIGELEAKHGKMSADGNNSHVDVWVRVDSGINNDFKVVD